MGTESDESLREWERAEIGRSSTEASRIGPRDMEASAELVARYRNPPDTTAYPLEFAYHLAGDIQGKRVLDFGCGTGANSLLLASRGAHVCGIDISQDLLAIARQRLAHHPELVPPRFLTASAHDLPLQDASFDLVFGIAILHHLDLRLVSREVHRVLKPGGRAIFQEPVRDSRLIELGRRLFPARDDVSPYEHPLTSASIAEFAAPFRKVSSRAFTLPQLRLARHLGLFRKNQGVLYRLDAALLKRFPRLECYTAVRVMELVK